LLSAYSTDGSDSPGDDIGHLQLALDPTCVRRFGRGPYDAGEQLVDGGQHHLGLAE
jgi:hypothetical protein